MPDEKLTDNIEEEIYEDLLSWEEVLSEMFSINLDDTQENISAYLNIGNHIEIERLELIMYMLRRRKGYQETSEALQYNNMRTLYPRTISEFVLIYCLQYNDQNANNRYNLTRFNNLLRRIKNFINYNDVTTPMPRTLAELRTIIDNNTEVIDNNRETLNETILVRKELERIDYKSDNSEEQLENLASQYYSSLVNAHEITRYYVAKYLYFVICEQLIEMQKIIFDLRERYARGSDKSEAIEYLKNLSNETSISEKLCSYLYRFSGDPDLSMILRFYPCDNIDTLIREETGLSFDKCILRALCRNHVLFSETALRDKTFLLQPNEPKTNEDNKIYYRNFSDNIISLYESKKIDYAKLFSYVFYVSEDMVSKISTKKREAFMTDILTGNANISRNALIWFLVSCRSAINCDTLKSYNGNDYDLLLEFDELSDGLSFSVINHIMSRIGYPQFVCNEDNDEARNQMIEKLRNKEPISVDLDKIMGRAFYQNMNNNTLINDMINALTDYYEDYGLPAFLEEEISLLSVRQIFTARKRRNNNHE